MRWLLAVISTAASVLGQNASVPVPPASQGVPFSAVSALQKWDTHTDASTIVATALAVDQKSGATGDMRPDRPVAATAVTAVDGILILTNPNTTLSPRSLPAHHGEEMSSRAPSDYTLVFSGTGTGPEDRDAAIEATAFLTYTVVNNATYNVDDCLAFCDSIEGCVFVNLYYEFNNELLDFVFSQKSNLKCAAYADLHTAAEKTNFGGQQSEPAPAPLTFIQQSSGFSTESLVNPPDPDGYELVFGPTNGANNAAGYMGFVFLDKYDVDACASQCNERDADDNGGVCQFFNIWRAVVNGVPTTYTCSMYFLVADESTAVNTGQGNLVVTFSRGYKRKNFVVDGGFEGFVECDLFCFDTSYSNWIGTSAADGFLDATIFFNVPFAHTGHGSGLLGAATGNDSFPGTLTPALPLTTVSGQEYVIQFFQSSSFSTPALQQSAFVDIEWNGRIVETLRPGFSTYKPFQVQVRGQGRDLLAFHGGRAPAWTFIDDISVFQL